MATTKWNIVFLIYAEITDDTNAGANVGGGPNDSVEFKTTEFLTTLMVEIGSIRTSDNFNIFVIENKITLHGDVKMDDVTTLKRLLADPADESKSNLIDVDPNINVGGHIHLLQNADSLGGIFKYMDTEFPAEKVFLNTWDHGSAFGVFKTTLDDDDEQQAPQAMQPQFVAASNRVFDIKGVFKRKKSHHKYYKRPFKVVQNRPFRYKSEVPAFLSAAVPATGTTAAQPHLIAQESFPAPVTAPPATHIEILTNAELAAAIKEGFGDKGVEMLCMFNCCMQNMHTGYALKDAVKVLVAPEGMIGMPGYDYVAIANTLADTPDIEMKPLATIVLDTMEAKFGAQDMAAEFDELAIYAILLEGYQTKLIEPLINLGKDLTAYINNNIPDNRSFVISSRQICYEMTYPLHYFIIDINNWLLTLENNLQDQYINLFNQQKFLDNCQKSICYQKVGRNFYNTRIPGDQNRPPTGFAIYFPSDEDEDAETDITRLNFIDMGAPNFDPLIQAINWQSFFDALFVQ